MGEFYVFCNEEEVIQVGFVQTAIDEQVVVDGYDLIKIFAFDMEFTRLQVDGDKRIARFVGSDIG
ncbi:MAG: hypothetical protein IJE90_06170 [Clostridia bacterium]|nr:hypothetical protein [Clostridia bacterium]